ncbi:MAG: hypothetical protein PHW69_08320 [Elusimicrobiaceae bacterium]|nr:hypothetical protein [Elusimicrobiaceae bacterium]
MHTVFAAGFGLFALISAYISARRHADALAGLESVFPGRTFLRWLVPTFQGSCDAFDFTVRLFGFGENGAPRLVVGMKSFAVMRLEVKGKSRGFSFGGLLGRSKEIKTGDDVFDGEFAVSAPDEGAAVRYLASREKREIIRRVFSAGYRKLVLRNGEITIEKLRYADADITPPALADVVRSLAVLAKEF